MTENPGQIVYRSLRAPKENGGVLIEPPIAEFAAQVSKYYQNPDSWERHSWKSHSWNAKSFEEHKRLARYEVLLEVLGGSSYAMEHPIIMVGHQPQLFHPGVWMKNSVADRLARIVGGPVVNLIVDNDVMNGASIDVPSKTSEGATTQIAFDLPVSASPYEECRVVDPDLATSFVKRVTAAMPPAEGTPLLGKFWSPVATRANSSNRWSEILSQARNDAERTLGLCVLDISLSHVVNTTAFAWLVLEIVHDARRFAEIYNAALAEYRLVHRLRSRAHPAPDLEIGSEYEIELPFWLWSESSPRRRRTFLRRHGESFTITDREGLEWSGSFDEGETLATRLQMQVLAPPKDPAHPKLRPKALITTLFARAFLCDGFVHGIGGYKYDQVTQAIAERWGLGKLAPMQCATMTLRLPLPMEVVTEDEVRSRKRKLRNLTYHPENFLSEANLSNEQLAKADALIADKKKWLSRNRPEELRERHQALNAINIELATMLGGVRERSEAAYKSAHDRFHAQQPWLSREFAAVLFPEEMLKREFARAVGE